MINFETELNKLLSLETGELPDYEFAEIAAAGREILAEFDKKQTDTSLQIEEIYDLVKEQDFLRETAASERARADRLIPAIIGLADLLEDFYAYAGQSGSEELKHQAKLQRENAGGILSSCGVLRFGEAGQALNPQYHTVKASVESPFPKEQVVQVLQSGYVYQGAIVRKAAVVVSRGQVPEETSIEETSIMDHDDDQEYDKGEQEDEQNSWY